MKTLLIVLVLVSIACLVSCHKFTPEPDTQKILVKITDESGKEVSEVSGGSILKIHSEYFKFLNQNDQDLQKEGRIIIDNEEIELLDAEGDFVTFSLPYLSHEIRELILNFRYHDLLIRLLCRNRTCLFYLPTVEGRVYAGMTDGTVDDTFTMPSEMCVDAVGNLYVIDQRDAHDVVHKVNTSGASMLFAGGGDEFGRLVGIGLDESRNRLYLADATAQQVKYIDLVTPGTVSVLAGSGTVGNEDGTGIGASFHFGTQRVDNFSVSEKGQGLDVDAEGNVYVGEIYDESTQSSQIRRITPAGVVSTVPGSRTNPMDESEVFFPAGLTQVPSAGIYSVGGPSSLFQGIVHVDSGMYSKVAGRVNPEELNDGAGPSAKFSFPKAIDYKDGYMYIADGTNGALRRASLTGEVITLAGVGHFDTPTWCFCGPEVPTGGSYIYPSSPLFASNPDIFEQRAANIVMDQVGGVVAKNGGIIYVSDYGYNVIWEIRLH